MKNLFVFDLDGTVTTEEILPRIANELSLDDSILEITRKTVDGLIPFEESFRRRVEILSRFPVSRIRKICEDVELEPSIERFIRSNPSECVIVTGNLDVWVGEIALRLGVGMISSIGMVSGDKLIGIQKVLVKEDVLNDLQADCVISIGEGNNDAELMRRSDLAIAYGGVHLPANSVLAVCTHLVFNGETLCRLLRRL